MKSKLVLFYLIAGISICGLLAYANNTGWIFLGALSPKKWDHQQAGMHHK